VGRDQRAITLHSGPARLDCTVWPARLTSSCMHAKRPEVERRRGRLTLSVGACRTGEETGGGEAKPLLKPDRQSIIERASRSVLARLASVHSRIQSHSVSRLSSLVSLNTRPSASPNGTRGRSPQCGWSCTSRLTNVYVSMHRMESAFLLNVCRIYGRHAFANR
jgi:hypothetical protein